MEKECSVCGGSNLVEFPTMGFNCEDCNPILESKKMKEIKFVEIDTSCFDNLSQKQKKELEVAILSNTDTYIYFNKPKKSK